MLFIAYAATTTRRAPHHRPPPPRPVPALPDVPRVSFLVAAKDEEEGIEECVRSMAGSDQFDGSRRRGRRVRGRHARDPTAGARTTAEGPLLEENVGKKHALVKAAEQATGEVIAFTDSDCARWRPTPAALRVTALVHHPSWRGQCHARALNPDATHCSPRTQDVWYEGQFRVAKAAEATFGSVSRVGTARRSAATPSTTISAWGGRPAGGEFRFATDRQLTGYVLGQC
ncbi:glycosyltransferase family 2 protein [Streptomyces sp. KL116D]|uniref:glycosyltransferase n=1 Tax=Streptomyces sp. KL116D TaxID=3045152 RepID=UPI003557BA54